ncbi:hypothetical protein GVAV_001637 [Gurleya vavrai]
MISKLYKDAKLQEITNLKNFGQPKQLEKFLFDNKSYFNFSYKADDDNSNPSFDLMQKTDIIKSIIKIYEINLSVKNLMLEMLNESITIFENMLKGCKKNQRTNEFDKKTKELFEHLTIYIKSINKKKTKILKTIKNF